MIWVLPLITAQLKFFNVESLEQNVRFKIFKLNILFLIFLIIIYIRIIKFSKVYIELSLNSAYFKIIILLFLFRIIILILRNSWIVLIFGWEGLGFSSFLLILFYHNWNRIKGSYLTIIRNRFGDCFLLLRLMYLLANNNYSFIWFLVILIAAITKRAQFPFNSWLPAAIAAPTPVSALVHSRTLVTAGVYFSFRFKIPLDNLIYKNLIIILAMFTIFLGSFFALIEEDLKKLVAFSTLRQLGLIFLSFFTIHLGLIFFHLLVHAFFKRLIFIFIGLRILTMNSQSLSVNNVYNLKNFIFFSFLITAILNMMRILFFRGFFSKETLIGMLRIKFVLYILITLLVASITLIYSVRLIIRFMFIRLGVFSSSWKILARLLPHFLVINLSGYLFLKNMVFIILNTFFLKIFLYLLIITILIKSNLFKEFKNSLNKLLSLFVREEISKDFLNHFFRKYFSMLPEKILNWKNLSIIILIILISWKL